MDADPIDPSWTCSHFSLSNPRGRYEADRPRLLRRLATHISQLPDKTMVLDINFHRDVTERGPWHSATAYYSSGGWADDDDQP